MLAASAVRSALSAIGNAEAVRPPAAPARTAGSRHVAGAAAGLGAREVPRAALSEAAARAIVRREITDRLAAAEDYDRAGRPDRADRLRREADVLRLAELGQPAEEGFPMSDEYPPRSGFVVTHFLVVSDQDRSRDFYGRVFGATVVSERDPVIMRMANSWLILNVGGGPTDDKPTVTLATPADPDTTSAFINLRVADIGAAYAQWSARGAEFLTEPKEHAHEIRAYIRDPDGHLIEVGQARERAR